MQWSSQPCLFIEMKSVFPPISCKSVRKKPGASEAVQWLTFPVWQPSHMESLVKHITSSTGLLKLTPKRYFSLQNYIFWIVQKKKLQYFKVEQTISLLSKLNGAANVSWICNYISLPEITEITPGSFIWIFILWKYTTRQEHRVPTINSFQHKSKHTK